MPGIAHDLDAVLYIPFQVDAKPVLVRAAVQGANDVAAYLYRAGCAGVCALVLYLPDRHRVGPGPARKIRAGAKVPDARFRRPEQDQAVCARAAVVIAAVGDPPSGAAGAVVRVNAEQERIGERAPAGLAALHLHLVQRAGIEGEGEPVAVARFFDLAGD